MTVQPLTLPPLPRREHDPHRERIESGHPGTPTVRPRIPFDRNRPDVPRHLTAAPPDEVRSLIGPVLTRLAAELPTLRSALVCRPDGMAMAAHGLSPDGAAHLAVLASTLHGTGSATAGLLPRAEDGEVHPIDFVSLGSGPTQTVVVVVPAAGSPLLAITADDCSLGRMLVQARATAERVRSVLEGRPL